MQAGYYLILEATGVDTDDLSPTPFLEGGTEYLIGLAILAIAVAPFAEELFFRGFHFCRVVGGGGGRYGLRGLAPCSSWGRTLNRLGFHRSSSWACCSHGYIIGTRALWAPMLVHFLNNAIAVGVLFADIY